MRVILHSLWLALIAVVALAANAPARAETRVALVIGNAAYSDVPRLSNPVNDAMLMAETLRGLGFKLVGDGAQLDLDKAGFDRAVQNFGAQLQGADVALFYYAGHGVQVRGGNYLVPVNANPTREADVDFQMLDMNLVLRQMEGAGTRLNLVILDACRNNPFGGRGLRATTGGLAQMQAPEGTLISFATQPGNVAKDGDDGHSPYTRALAETIRRPGLGLFDAFNEVGLAVKQATGNAQQPWVSASPIKGNFFFTAPPAPASLPQQVKLQPPSAAATLQPAPATDCDRFAASPSDADRPASVPGVAFDQIDAGRAISACRAALTQYPQDQRLTYILARALQAGQQFDEAARLYRKAADAGNAPAMISLGGMYRDGRGVAKDEAEAVRLYRKAADAGNAAAIARLGFMYKDGRGVAKDDAEAVRLYRKAADAGNATAMNNLGFMYETGRGVAKDDAEAVRLYRKAADAGDATAMANLGFMYLEGRGVAKDDAEAVRLFRKAADAGARAAMYNLAFMYENGRGVKRDTSEAKRLYKKAADLGDDDAQKALARLR